MAEELAWLSEWQMEIPVLDAQHHALFQHLNRIATDSTDNPDACRQLLETFLTKLREHFQAEEALMTTVGYPKIAAHRREHAMLAAELQQLIREITQGTATCDTALHEIRDWYISHVAMDGREFASFYSTLPSVTESDGRISKRKA